MQGGLSSRNGLKQRGKIVSCGELLKKQLGAQKSIGTQERRLKESGVQIVDDSLQKERTVQKRRRGWSLDRSREGGKRLFRKTRHLEGKWRL